MPVAEIITIGTELLLGEIVDTNTRYLAKTLKNAGIDLYRTMTVGDNPGRIAGAIQEAMARAEIVITTGGLGPTVDDPTRLAVAMAVGVETIFMPELWDQIQERFKRYGRQATDNNKRQAYIPAGATPIENPVGTAPAFLVEKGKSVVISLPGVPREMEHLTENFVIPWLREKFAIVGVIKAQVIHTAGVGESQIDEWVGEFEEYENPTVGLLAHPGCVDIRITAKAGSIEDADRLIADMRKKLLARLGNSVYGYDDDRLEDGVIQLANKSGTSFCLLEANLDAELSGRLEKAGLNPELVMKKENPLNAEDLHHEMDALAQKTKTDISIGVSFQYGKTQQEFIFIINEKGTEEVHNRSYGGPPAMAKKWAAVSSLDYIRRYLNKKI